MTAGSATGKTRCSSPSSWRTAIAAAAVLGGGGSAVAACPVLGELLAVAVVAGALTLALIVLSVVLGGSDKAVERIFRLLRWVANRPEPTAPLDGKTVRSVTRPEDSDAAPWNHMPEKPRDFSHSRADSKTLAPLDGPG